MQKKYSLALGWWAARWYVHIGVLKYIEENNIEINEVSWTSMWAIIGACYALWKTSEEIKNIAKEISLFKLIDFDFKKWFVAGNKIYKFLEEIFWDICIENTDIKLKIIATDLDSCEKKVFTKWKIVDAVRASISLPMIFATFNYDDKNYVDWWLKSNLPILELDWDEVIAVSAVRDKSKKFMFFDTERKVWISKWFFWYNNELTKKLVTITMWTIEDLTLEIAKYEWKKVILIAPDLWEFEFHDFKKVDELSDRWYEEAKKKL